MREVPWGIQNRWNIANVRNQRSGFPVRSSPISDSMDASRNKRAEEKNLLSVISTVK